LRSRSQVIMTSIKVLSFLLVVGLSQSAPQISRQGVVSQVIGQLQPAIQRIVASTLGGGRQTAGFGQTGAVPVTNFGQFSQGSSFGQGSTLSSGVSASQLTSNVVTSLQPAIAAAVAQALRSSQSRPALSGTSVSALTPEEEARINAQQSANAQYQFGYKVGDDDTQTYIAHEESRDGENVQGSYNYVDPTGSLVTVNYEAGPMGYTENREVQEGAVQFDARNIPEPWTGPLAGVSSTSAASSGVGNGGSSFGAGAGGASLSQSDLIAQILRAIQPQINSAVQSAIGSRTTASSGSFGVGSGSASFGAGAGGASFGASTGGSSFGVGTSGRGSNSQSNLISTIIGSLQPQISGAVQSALSRSRSAQQVRRPVASRPSTASGVSDLFGGSGVRIQTPEFNIQY